MRNKWLASLLAGATLFCSPFAAKAAQLDAYRDMVVKQSFTLKYSIAPSFVLEQEHNQRGMGEYTWADTDWVVPPNQGVIIVDGGTRYLDKFDGDLMVSVSPSSLSGGVVTTEELAKEKGEKKPSKVTHTCLLIKNGETFSYRRTDDGKGKSDYAGRYKGGYERSQVMAGEHYTALSPFDAMMQEMDYGDPRIAKMLAIICPPDPMQTFIDIPEYSLVDSGTLKSGLSYEDYAASEEGRYYAARYYFDKGRLVKFAAVSFPESLDVTQGGIERSLIDIEEFSPVPDRQYLSLPVQLKVVTGDGQR